MLAKPKLRNDMKILYVCPYLPSIGMNAGCNRMFELVKRLALRNEISIVSFITPGERVASELKKICKRVDVVTKDYDWIRGITQLPSMVSVFFHRPMQEIIDMRLKEEDFDILHFEYLVMAQYAPYKCRPLKFLTEHEVHFLTQLRDITIEACVWNKMKLWYDALKSKIYEINIIKRFDGIITMTEREAQILHSYAPSLNVSSVGMGVDNLYFRPKEAIEEDIDIIFIGFFRHRPNVDAVHYFYGEIFPMVQVQYPEAHFTIIGDDPPDSIQILRQNPNVTVMGYVEDVRPYISRSKVFIMPIRLGTGMRGKLFEAWGMAKAVVSTSIGCEGVNAVDGENILIADKPGEFSEKVVSLLHNVDKRKYLGQNGRRVVEEINNWDILADRLERFYRKTAKNIFNTV